VLAAVVGMGATGTSVGDMYRAMLGIAVVALAVAKRGRRLPSLDSDANALSPE
jgi:hypothetical protein